ncbi:MAG: MoxR family ATPase [Polyangiaceae bacterium]|nr:MoxR family ATPase [Polyangiaceae bacterium]
MQAELIDRVAAAKERLDAVRREVARVYIGPAHAVDLMLVALLARGHVLVEGVPGVAKTTLAKAFAASLGATVRRIQFTPDLLPADITGTYVLSPRDGTFTFRRGPIFANVVLADEINRAPAKTQSALLEAMQEQQVTVEGDSYELPGPFVVLATQNPIDLEGTYPLPEAQIDRFLVRLGIGYPRREDEVAMLVAHQGEQPAARPVLDAGDVLRMQALCRSVHVDQDLYEYAVSLTTFTRTDPRVLLGASPRATLGLVQAAKAAAVLGGRSYATPDDVRALGVAVLAHRLVLADETEAEHKLREDVVKAALERVSYRKAIRPA